jgi:hypothetical protein
VSKGMEPDLTYTVHERLLSEATGPLVRNGIVHAEEGTEGLLRRFQDILQRQTQEAYTRGVRDGYVQAVHGSCPECGGSGTLRVLRNGPDDYDEPCPTCSATEEGQP